MLLSATMPVEVLEVTKNFMRAPLNILVNKDEITLEGIKQFYINVEKEVSYSHVLVLQITRPYDQVYIILYEQVCIIYTCSYCQVISTSHVLVLWCVIVAFP